LRRKLFNFAAAISSLFLAALVVAFFVSDSLDLQRQFVTLSPTIHISMDRRDANANFYVFNSTIDGPFLNGITGITSQGSRRPPLEPAADEMWNSLGMHYRMVRWRNGKLLRTLAVSMYYPLAFSAILPIVWLMCCLRRPRRGRGFPVTTLDAKR